MCNLHLEYIRKYLNEPPFGRKKSDYLKLAAYEINSSFTLVTVLLNAISFEYCSVIDYEDLYDLIFEIQDINILKGCFNDERVKAYMKEYSSEQKRSDLIEILFFSLIDTDEISLEEKIEILGKYFSKEVLLRYRKDLKDFLSRCLKNLTPLEVEALVKKIKNNNNLRVLHG